MELIEFPEQNTVIAKDQPEYAPMPARRIENSPTGELICCWQLTPEEIEKVRETGVIWHSIYTFANPLQPQLLSVDKPDMVKGSQ